MGAFSRLAGEEAVHYALKDVTGQKIASFRDPALTISMMTDVITEFIHRFPDAWRDIQARRRRPGRGGGTDTIEAAISPDKQRALWKLRNILKIDDVYFNALCLRALEVGAPADEAMALTMIGVLNRIVRQERKNV